LKGFGWQIVEYKIRRLEGGVKVERYVKLLIALLVSALFIFIPNFFNGIFNHYFSSLTGQAIMWVITELVQLIGLIAFLKIVYLWIKEFWKLK
jgi:hypothetical protein